MRIVIFGRPGSGKSTFAYRLSQETGIPVFHMDKYFFSQSWAKRPTEDFVADVREIIAQDHWIVDGNATKSIQERFERATHILYFNYPKLVCLWRIFKRIFSKLEVIDDRAPHCPERPSLKLITYMWRFERRFEKLWENLDTVLQRGVAFYQIRQEKDLLDVLEKLRKNKS